MFIQNSESVHRAELIEICFLSENDTSTVKIIIITELCHKQLILDSAVVSKERKLNHFR